MATLPIRDRSADRTVRFLGDIFTGPNGTGSRVPNVDDIIYDFILGWFRCISVDETTNLSELIPWEDPVKPYGVQPTDVLLGVGPGYQSSTYRIMINNSVLPRRMYFDDRLHSLAVDAAYCIVYLGSDITTNQIAVSANYDQNMSYIDNKVSLTLAEEIDGQNYTKKVPLPAYCNRSLVSGTPLTVVMYNAAGTPLSTQVLLARDTAFIPAGDAATRRIVNISIDTPFLSPDEENTLLIPVDTDMDSLGIRGVIHYNDGPRFVGLDQAKFTLDGLEHFVASYPNQKHPLVLTYNLGPGEAAEAAIQLPNGKAHVARSYTARIIDVPGSKNVKLFVIPSWDAINTRWQLEYFIYSLDRGSYHYVDPSLIELGTNSPSFDPVNYQIVQHLTVALDIEKVHPSLPKHRHVQAFDVALRGNGVNQGNATQWYLYYTPNDPTTAYGDLLFCEMRRIAVGVEWEVRIDCGLSNLTEWLDKVFYRTQPLYDRKNETRAPTPTHFILSINGINNEYPISSWNTIMSSETGGAQSGAAIIHFIAKVGNTHLQLGASPLRIVQIV